MTLAEHIDDIRDNMENNRYISERDVSDNIVLRILCDALHWPRYDKRIVCAEYRLEGGRVDFALCHPIGKPKVFIEVKDVGKIDDGVDQLFEYAFLAAFRQSVSIIVLTDGHKWRFYNARADGSYEDRVAYEMDLIEEAGESAGERLTRYLCYESVQSGEAIEAIKEDHKKGASRREAGKNLPKAWKNLIEKESENLFLALSEETKDLCEHEPTIEQIKDFLKSLKPPPPPPPPPNGDKNGSKKNGGKKPPTRLAVTMPDGSRIYQRFASETFADVIDRIGIEQIKSLNKRLSGHTLISTSVPSTGYTERGEYYIATRSNTATKKQIIEEIAAELGIAIQVEIVEN